MKILLPVDGSDPSLRAVDEVIRQLAWYQQRPEIDLLNVQHHVGGLVSSFVSSEQIKQYREDEGMAALRPAMKKLDDAGATYQYHIGVGNESDVIVQHAKDHRCDQIVMATHGKGLSKIVLGSVTAKVIALSPMPVLLVK